MEQFKNRSFLKLLDYTPEEINELLKFSAELKAKKKAGIPHRMCEGKSIALVFEKTSTRTRCAFEVAAADLGMHPVYISFIPFTSPDRRRSLMAHLRLYSSANLRHSSGSPYIMK